MFFLFFLIGVVIISTGKGQTSSFYGRTTGINPVAFTLTIFNPKQQASYTNTMNLQFDLTWNASLETMFTNHPVVEGYAYSIDPNSGLQRLNNSVVNVIPNGTLPIPPQSYWFSYTINISNLTNGYHKIAIIAYQYIYGPPPLNLFSQSSAPITFLVQNPTPSTTPTITPTVPEFPAIVILPLLLSMFVGAVILRHRKTNNLSTSTFPTDYVAIVQKS
jgi:hypothetical protein